MSSISAYVDLFRSTYSRRITENTKGCIIRILSGRLNLMPSVVINHMGAINVDLDASTPMLQPPYSATPVKETNLVPVLYITKFTYLGADGTDILGNPQLLRQSKRVKAAVQLRHASSRTIESLSPESPKTQKFKTPTQFRTPNQPFEIEGNEVMKDNDNVAHEDKLEAQRLSISDFATQPAPDWSSDQSTVGVAGRRIEPAVAVSRTTTSQELEVGEKSFELDVANSTSEFSRSDIDIDSNIDGEESEEMVVCTFDI
ncbi:hypothetical protein V1509DRAFT_652748 [Lipomyces kononenkoae]